MSKERKRIVKLRLYRFQSHADTTLNFDKETNAFVGKTDAGKSAITRALYWVLYNRPLKSKREDLTTWGAPHCFVTLELSDGTEITRGRKKDENYYVLKKPGKDELTFKGFGTDVPEEILDAHGMPLLTLDDGSGFSLNISQQLEPIFMFEDGSSKRAKVIGKLSGADRVDGGLSVLNNWRHESSIRKKELLRSIEIFRNQLESFNVIEDIEAAICILEDLINLVECNTETHQILQERVQRLRDIGSEREQLLLLTQYEHNIIDVQVLLTKLDELSRTRDLVHSSYSSYSDILQDIAIAHELLSYEADERRLGNVLDTLSLKISSLGIIAKSFSAYQQASREIRSSAVVLNYADNLDEANTALESLDTHLNTLTELKDFIGNYAALLHRINIGEIVVDNLSEKYEELSSQYRELLVNLEECPFCKSHIGKDKFGEIDI